MSNYLPSYYYVYGHMHPETEKFVYIGHGSRGRAWIHGSRRTVLRSQDHLDFLEGLNLAGYLPTDWVVIFNRGLTKKVACEIERSLIKNYNPMFNKPQGVYTRVMSKEDVDRAKELRKQGLSYAKIGDELKVSTMTARRAVLDLYKNKEEYLNVK